MDEAGLFHTFTIDTMLLHCFKAHQNIICTNLKLIMGINYMQCKSQSDINLFIHHHMYTCIGFVLQMQMKHWIFQPIQLVCTEDVHVLPTIHCFHWDTLYHNICDEIVLKHTLTELIPILHFRYVSSHNMATCTKYPIWSNVLGKVHGIYFWCTQNVVIILS